MPELGRLSQDEFKTVLKIPVLVVLDNIRSFNNVGSIFRTADAFRIGKIYLCGFTPCPPHRDITKTALGASETVDWEYVASAQEICNQLKKSGYELVAVEQTQNASPLQSFEMVSDQKYVLIFGNEVDGVQDSLLEMCDKVIEVPQEGTKHSLNISVCFGIVAWEFFRKLRASTQRGR